jgi:ribosomal protein S18 acetylase RimI-like enzyme
LTKLSNNINYTVDNYINGDAVIMDGYTFLLVNYDDIPEVVRIYHSLIGTPGCTWNLDYPNRATAESDINSKSLYILKKNDKTIAVASVGEFNELGHLQWTPKKPCELARIGVIPSMQKQGIGTIILQNIIEKVKEKGFDGIRMLVSKTNPAALALYDKNGFERCGETFMFDIDFYCYQIKFNKEH